MEVNDAFVIFPEGANYTERRYRRSIEKLREIGRPDLAERAGDLKNTLPPRSKGVMTALATAPDNSDVFLVGHAGLETFVAPGDIRRGILSTPTLRCGFGTFPSRGFPLSWSRRRGCSTCGMRSTHGSRIGWRIRPSGSTIPTPTDAQVRLSSAGSLVGCARRRRCRRRRGGSSRCRRAPSSGGIYGTDRW